MPDVPSSRSHARVRSSSVAQESPDAAEAPALHDKSWYYHSEKQIQSRMRKFSRWGRRGHDSNLACGPLNAGSYQYLLGPAYADDDGFVPTFELSRSQLSV